MKDFFAWLFRRPTNRQIEPVDPALLIFFEELERLKPDPGDSHELLLNKASRLIDHYFQLHNLSVPPSHTSLDVARHLESLNTPTPARMALPTTDYARKVGDKQEEKNLKEEKISPEKYFT